MSHQDYTPDFYQSLGHNSARSAAAIVPLLYSLLSPKRVIDAGCGAGDWLAAFKAAGATHTLGIEGPWVDAATTGARMDVFVPADIGRQFPVLPPGPFDLALCIEVGEHLAAARASELVRFLASSSETIAFSAAIPGQGGTHHINEQWQGYWAKLFAQFGFQPVPGFRSLIWNLDGAQPCVRQNLVLYVSSSRLAETTARVDSELARRPRSEIINVVHPDLYEERLRTLTSDPAAIRSHLTLRLVLPSLPSLAWRALETRLRRLLGRSAPRA